MSAAMARPEKITLPAAPLGEWVAFVALVIALHGVVGRQRACSLWSSGFRLGEADLSLRGTCPDCPPH